MEAGERGIKAITFDVGGVLAEGKPDHRLYAERVLSHLASLGFGVREEKWLEATSGALSELGRKRREGREMSFEEFSSLQLSSVGVEPNQELLEKMLSLYLSSFPRKLKRGAGRVVEELASSYKLGAVSNSMSPAPRRFLEERGLDRYFGVILVSGEVGYRKPHPEIFLRALRELRVSPEEAVHVGDRADTDGGAKGVGMRFVLLSPSTPEGVEADAVVPSVREVPGAVEMLSRGEEFVESLGKGCFVCSSPHFSLYELEGEPLLLCPRCRRSFRQRVPRPRKHGKYRAVYRRAWRDQGPLR
ncbi:MAG: HAD family hydrolase [Candidatus Hadarchaeales archaeon]